MHEGRHHVHEGRLMHVVENHLNGKMQHANRLQVVRQDVSRG